MFFMREVTACSVADRNTLVSLSLSSLISHVSSSFSFARAYSHFLQILYMYARNEMMTTFFILSKRWWVLLTNSSFQPRTVVPLLFHICVCINKITFLGISIFIMYFCRNLYEDNLAYKFVFLWLETLEVTCFDPRTWIWHFWFVFSLN